MSSCFVEWTHVLPGLAGGVVSSVVCYPLELCETRLQARPRSSPVIGPRDVLGDVLRTRGPRGLFDGVDAALCSALAGWMAYFGVYAELDAIMPAADVASLLVKTTTSGMAATMVNTPFQVFKTKRILRPEMTTEEIVSQISGSAAPLARWWTGIRPALLGVSTIAVQFTLFYMLASRCSFVESVTQAAMFGAASTLLAGLATYPVNLLKTRAMAGGSADGQSKAPPSLYAGIGPYILRTVPPSALLFGVQRLVESGVCH